MTAEPAGAEVLPGSPGLTIRQAVRSVAFAYAILSAEQDRAAALADQACSLVQDICAFLEAAGLGHLLGTTPATATPVADPKAILVEVYASAALRWAQIISSASKLGAILIERQSDDVQRLAAALQEAGEARAATDLSYSWRDAVDTEQEVRLALISNATPPVDLARALEIARGAFRAFQRDAPSALGILPRYLESIHIAIVSWQAWGGLGYVPWAWTDRAKPTAAEIAMRLDQLEPMIARAMDQRRGWGSFT